MKPTTAILGLLPLTCCWMGSLAQDYSRFCSLRICSQPPFNLFNIGVQTELTYCNNGRTIRTSSRILCSSSRNVCRGVFNLLRSCATVMQMPIPPTSTQIPTLSTDDPTSQSSSTYNETSGQVSKLINERDKLRAAVVSLGVLMGVLVILLAVVITGWVWTCWKMKRYKATDTTQENLRTVQNVAYGSTRLVDNSARDELTLGHLERRTENDHQIVYEVGGGNSGEEHGRHTMEGLGGHRRVPHSRELETRKLIEGEDEHDYYVLEDPESEGQSIESAMNEVGGVSDYEIPLQLKK